jgi:hypothetical protein
MWIGASLFMAAVAAFSFRLVNELILNPAPELAAYFKVLGAEKLRILARYQASEFNRALFEGWGLTQILLGLLIFGILLFGTKEGKLILGLSLFMVILTTGMHLLVTPSIVGYGRSLDFLSAEKEPELRNRVKVFHNTYSTLEGVKIVCGLTLLVIFFREVRKKPGRDTDNRYEEPEAA